MARIISNTKPGDEYLCLEDIPADMSDSEVEEWMRAEHAQLIPNGTVFIDLLWGKKPGTRLYRDGTL